MSVLTELRVHRQVTPAQRNIIPGHIMGLASLAILKKQKDMMRNKFIKKTLTASSQFMPKATNVITDMNRKSYFSNV